MGTEEEVSVEQAAAARRERLKALRAAQELLSAGDDDSGQADDNNKATDDDDDDNDNEDAEDFNLSMKFRNYVPHDKQLQEGKVTPPELPKFEDPVAAAPPQSEKKELNRGNGGLESEASVVNDGVSGVNGGYSGDEREEIGGKEMEKFEAEEGEAVGT
ncbi:hypothetical protein WN943_015231 [Citrus x changshan-huyou]